MEKDELQSTFLDDAILNSEIMGAGGRWRERVNYSTITFYVISYHLVNNHDLEKKIVHIMFTYESYGERSDEKKNNFLWRR